MAWAVIASAGGYSLTQESEPPYYCIYAETSDCEHRHLTSGPARQFGWTYVAGFMARDPAMKKLQEIC